MSDAVTITIQGLDPRWADSTVNVLMPLVDGCHAEGETAVVIVSTAAAGHSGRTVILTVPRRPSPDDLAEEDWDDDEYGGEG